MYRTKHYTLIPFVFSGVGAVHFLPYAWLYQTAVYIVMPILIAVILAILYGKERHIESISETTAAKACLTTGFILLLTGMYFVLTL